MDTYCLWSTDEIFDRHVSTVLCCDYRWMIFDRCTNYCADYVSCWVVVCIRYIFKWWQYVRFALPLPESYVSRAQTLLEKKRKSPNTQKLSRNYIYCRLGRRVSIVSFRRVDYFFLTSNLMVQNNRSTNLNEN